MVVVRIFVGGVGVVLVRTDSFLNMLVDCVALGTESGLCMLVSSLRYSIQCIEIRPTLCPTIAVETAPSLTKP